jgi:hypothetical protein
MMNSPPGNGRPCRGEARQSEDGSADRFELSATSYLASQPPSFPASKLFAISYQLQAISYELFCYQLQAMSFCAISYQLQATSYMLSAIVPPGLFALRSIQFLPNCFN